jgi:hypothetical protein
MLVPPAVGATIEALARLAGEQMRAATAAGAEGGGAAPDARAARAPLVPALVARHVLCLAL